MCDDIPMGFRFRPNDQESIIFLLKKLQDEALPQYVAKVCDLYSRDELWKKEFDINYDDQGNEEVHYFFTDLKKIADNGTRFERTVGGGVATWKSQKDTKIYNDKKEIIGAVRSFSYKKRSRSSERWVMHEYRLDGINKELTHANNYVMCKVTKKKNPQATHKNTKSKIMGVAETGGNIHNLEDGLLSDEQLSDIDHFIAENRSILEEL